MNRRSSLIAAAALSAAGIVLAALLTRQHASAHAGIASACNINEFVNCDRVARSAFSVFLGLPVAVWGLLGFGLLLTISVAGLAARRPHDTWPAGLLFVGSAAAAAVSVLLAILSEFAIGALCLYCAGSWLVSFALLATAWRACQPVGVYEALRADLGVVVARPVLTGATAVAMVALVAVTVRIQPRYWDKPQPPPAKPVASVGPPVVVEFSDYECPFCAKAHLELKALLATRPDVRLVKRHFPLDSSCNPIMKRPLHRDACALARAGICAEVLGRLPEMDDALFANQQAKRPVEELAAKAGLDAARFRDCLTSPETSRRLGEDIAMGIQIGLTATPTYVVNGVQYSGSLPPEALPARQGAEK
jgi:protein-disulfide isomerase